MLLIIANNKSKIIFTKNFDKNENALEYLIGYAALDTEDTLSIDDLSTEHIVLNSGHKIIFVKKNDTDEKKIPKKFVNHIINELKNEMLNPFIDTNEILSNEFERKIETGFNQFVFGNSFSL